MEVARKSVSNQLAVVLPCINQVLNRGEGIKTTAKINPFEEGRGGCRTVLWGL